MSERHDPTSTTHNTTPAGAQPRLERHAENLLWNARFIVLLAIVPSLLGAVVLFVVGSIDIIKVVLNTLAYYLHAPGAGTRADIHDSLVPDIIMAIDIYLIALVLLIFSLGVYRLFVSRIDKAEQSPLNHPFNVVSLDQLKDKIARVVILAVIIEFFRAVVDIRFATPLDAIYLALSVLALAAALYLMSLGHHDE